VERGKKDHAFHIEGKKLKGGLEKSSWKGSNTFLGNTWRTDGRRRTGGD